MPKYIDADALKAVMVFSQKTGNLKVPEMRDIITLIDDVPSADVAPVRHGRWLDFDDTERFTARCNLCNNVIDTRFGKHFCPECGADMREEEDDNEA